jgi:hypothetical protein
MRTLEKEKIWHYQRNAAGLKEQSESVIKQFPYYGKLINQLLSKLDALYKIYGQETTETNYYTRVKTSSKHSAILDILKLKRAVVIHALETGNKSLQRASDYTDSDFNRPSEDVRIARLNQILNAAKRIKQIEQFGISKDQLFEIEKKVKDYIEKSNSPLFRKKERARQARQCRKMLADIHFIIHNKIVPFFENVSDSFPHEASVMKGFLKPTKIGRPANKPERKRRVIAAANTVATIDVSLPAVKLEVGKVVAV